MPHSVQVAPAPSAKTRLVGMSWAHLLNDGVSNYLPGVLPAVLATLGEPAKMAGVLVTAMTIGQALQPLTGRLADRLGGRSLVILGLLMTSVGGGLIGFAPNTWLLIILLVVIGSGNAFFHPQAVAAVRRMVSHRQGLVTSVFLVGGELGRGLWPTAASLIVVHLGLGGLWLTAIPGILTAPFLFRWLPSQPAALTRGAAIRMNEHLKPMALLLGYQSVRTLTIYAFVTFIPILWNARGESLVTGATVITTMTTVGVVGNLWGGQLTDRIGTRATLVIAAVGSSVLIVPTAYLTGPAAWFAAGALGIALFLTASTTALLGQDIFPENRSMGSGIAMGFANGLGALGVFVISLLIGDQTMVIFWALAAMSLASAALALIFDKSLMH